MDNQAVQTGKVRAARGRQDAFKLLLVAGLSVQAWGFVMGLGLLILNIAH